MAELVKIKGLKGKQNKKKWAKNIDVSGLLEQRARLHDEEIREKHRELLVVHDDIGDIRLPLDPNRFKNKPAALPKKTYNNQITRQSLIDDADDIWLQNSRQEKQKQFYQQSEIPAVILPPGAHSYNPREGDVKEIIDRVIDFEKTVVPPKKEKRIVQLKQVEVRSRSKGKRAFQLDQRRRKEQKEFKQQLHNLKKIKQQLSEKQQKIASKIKTKIIKKEKLANECKLGYVRFGKRLGKRVYRFKELIPNPEEQGKKLSQVSLSDELVRDRFDTIFRRGALEARNVKVHANKRKHIKVKERFNE